MEIKNLAVGPLMANCYIVSDEKTHKAIVIDPGGDAKHIYQTLQNDGLETVAIINTHGHFDHVSGNKELMELTNAPLMIHEADAELLNNVAQSARVWGIPAENSPPPNHLLQEGDMIEFGNASLKILHTPGHSPGGISLVGDGVVFVGDTLFRGSIGRTDLPGGNFEILRNSIQKKLFALPDNTVAYCGHDRTTEIGFEKQFNMFVGINT